MVIKAHNSNLMRRCFGCNRGSSCPVGVLGPVLGNPESIPLYHQVLSTSTCIIGTEVGVRHCRFVKRHCPVLTVLKLSIVAGHHYDDALKDGPVS